MKTRNFNSKLHLACSKDTERPAQNLIYFKGGFAYCTNGHIAIRQKLEVHSLFPEDMDCLEGKFIHQEVFSKIISHDIIECLQDNIIAKSESGNITYPYHEYVQLNLDGKLWIDIEGQFDKHEAIETDTISFDYGNLQKISDAFVKENGVFIFRFNGSRNGIIVTTGENQSAILMPCKLPE